MYSGSSAAALPLILRDSGCFWPRPHHWLRRAKRIVRALIFGQMVLMSCLCAPRSEATVIDTGEVVVGPTGDLEIGVVTLGKRVVDGQDDGPYTSATLGVGTGSEGELDLLNGARFNSTGPMTVGLLGRGGVDASGRSLLETGGAILGSDQWPPAGAAGGRVTLDGSSWRNTGTLRIGRSSTVEVRKGSSVSTDGIRLFGSNGPGTRLEINGSRVVNSGSTSLAHGLPGSSLIIRNGGWLSDSGGEFNFGSTMLVTGTGSTWETGALTGGSHGGRIDVQSGGQIIAVSAAILSEQSVSVAVDGHGSALRVVDQLKIGGCCNVGSVRLDATSGGLIQSGSMVIGTVSGPGRLSVVGNGSRFETGLLEIGNSALPLPSSLILDSGATAVTHDAYIGCGVECGVSVNGSGSMWTSAGTVHVGRVSSGQLLPARIDVTNDGVVEIANRTVIEGPGRLTLLDGTIATPVVEIAGGIVSGVGIVQGSIINAGRVAPGEEAGNPIVSPGPLAIGDLRVSEGYTQLSTGALDITLAGSDGNASDRLLVEDAAVLAGLLDVSVLSTYTAALGDTFDLLVAGEIVGEFDQVALPALPGQLAWKLDYLVDGKGPDVVRLQAVPEPGTALLVGLGMMLTSTWRRPVAA